MLSPPGGQLHEGVFDIERFGAVGDGAMDCWSAIQKAFYAAIESDGCVLIPPGRFICRFALEFTNLKSRLSVKGYGANVSRLIFTDGASGLNLGFDQQGVMQPFGLTISDVGFTARGRCGTAIAISYGNPPVTSDHYQPSVAIRGVNVTSGSDGSWSEGIVLEAAWNVAMTDVFISGDSAGGVWNNMTGHGIRFERMCVNAHLENVRCNFWAVGLFYNAGDGPNTEGLFCSNCSMVGVKRGVWITGNPDQPAPRMSTLTWVGGLIECRVGGVEDGSAAFHLVNVWTALITGCQMLTETLDVGGITYCFFLDNCAGVVVTACDVSAWKIGLVTTGRCSAINSNSNTYTNTELQNCFTAGTTESRSYGHVLYNNPPNDQDASGLNKLGFVN